MPYCFAARNSTVCLYYFILLYTICQASIVCFGIIASIIIVRGTKMKPLKEKISITVDSDILAQIKLLAEKDERSLSQFVNLVLKKYLAEEKQ